MSNKEDRAFLMYALPWCDSCNVRSDAYRYSGVRPQCIIHAITDTHTQYETALAEKLQKQINEVEASMQEVFESFPLKYASRHCL